ncbi:unnamed protein product [Symbiodinium pilosum]|uniref:Uncharacterized protein n=1 Tax=Symbiodinium pilosum TaxID=2952 RepID=A0A812Q3R9_SYMPI|nr:unnamed protein product [Symbiodinium pilosum]
MNMHTHKKVPNMARSTQPALPEEGPLAAEVPRAESPALISRSQSSATNEAETQEMPTLLTSKAETQVPKVCMAGKDLPEKADRDEAEEAENSTVAMTTVA